MVTEPIKWIGTPEACARLGVTLRTLYRFIDEGQLPAYKMGRVIRLQASDVDAFIDRARITPGTLEHLYPDPRGSQADRATAGGSPGDDDAGDDDAGEGHAGEGHAGEGHAGEGHAGEGNDGDRAGAGRGLRDQTNESSGEGPGWGARTTPEEGDEEDL
jgi:excisionase family DNA binding protein